ncbi:MAG: tetratricopeptide repeat protein [Planctomycetota bacterium]
MPHNIDADCRSHPRALSVESDAFSTPSPINFFGRLNGAGAGFSVAGSQTTASLFAILLAAWSVLAFSANQVLGQEAVVEATEDATSTAPDAESDSDASVAEKEASEAPAVDPGQADLDAAFRNRIGAKTAKQFEEVEDLLSKAISKGLSGGNTKLARDMLGAVQFKLGEGLIQSLQRNGGRNALAIRNRALEYLLDAIQNDDTLVEAHALVAQLNVPGIFPNADPDQARKSVRRAIELYEDDPKKRSAMYAIAASLCEDADERIENLDLAIEADPENRRAVVARLVLLLGQGKIDEAKESLDVVLAQEPLNLIVLAGAVEALLEADRAPQAIDLLTDSIDRQKDDLVLEKLYRIRSRVHSEMKNAEMARADLDTSIRLLRNPEKLMERARLAVAANDLLGAKADLQAAVNLKPEIDDTPDAVLVKYFIASAEQRIPDAINEVKKLIRLDPFWKQELGRLYVIDDRPRQAVQIFDEVLAVDAENADVLRSRGDALLAIGAHAKAIQDYEAALTILESNQGRAEDLRSTDAQAVEYSGVLNNLAWVLATSPQADARNGNRSLQLAKESARLTDFKAPHILSTLAAAYAETGDLTKAIEYSQVAVDLGAAEGNEQLEQLRKELESYRSGEPWREKQETEENARPILSPEDLIDI